MSSASTGSTPIGLRGSFARANVLQARSHRARLLLNMPKIATQATSNGRHTGISPYRASRRRRVARLRRKVVRDFDQIVTLFHDGVCSKSCRRTCRCFASSASSVQPTTVMSSIEPPLSLAGGYSFIVLVGLGFAGGMYGVTRLLRTHLHKENHSVEEFTVRRLGLAGLSSVLN